jgi:hypothetical protein
MRVVDLPSPGKLANGIRIRYEAVKAINHVETVAPRMAGGVLDTADTLHAFFLAAAAAVEPYMVTPPAE